MAKPLKARMVNGQVVMPDVEQVKTKDVVGKKVAGLNHAALTLLVEKLVRSAGGLDNNDKVKPLDTW